MNWKLIGALAIGTGLLSACGAANQAPVDSGDREKQMDEGTTPKDPPPTEGKKNPTNEAVLHE